MVVSVWTKIGQCLEDSSSHCLFPVELMTNKAGQGGQGSCYEGPREVLFLLNYILKQTWWCLSVWTKIGQCLEDSFSHCPFPVELVTNRARQGSQGSRCGGPHEVLFLLKKSLGKTEGPASNQTKIEFKKKIIFHYRTY
jgi:hypothetical protein